MLQGNEMKKILSVIIMMLAFMTGTNVVHAYIGVSFTSPSDEYQDPDANNNNIVGWSFTANQDLYAKRLAVYDTDRDIRPETSHFIGLWDSNGNLMASATASEGVTPRTGFYHWADISQTRLSAGQTYYVGAVMGKDYYTAYVPESLDYGYGAPTQYGNLNVYSGITYLADAYYYLSSGESVNQITFGSGSLTVGLNGADTIIGGFGANIDLVPSPIPPAFLLMGSGLIGMAAMMRKKSAV
jgi:hypothetical protein